MSPRSSNRNSTAPVGASLLDQSRTRALSGSRSVTRPMIPAPASSRATVEPTCGSSVPLKNQQARASGVMMALHTDSEGYDKSRSNCTREPAESVRSEPSSVVTCVTSQQAAVDRSRATS